MKVKVRAIAKAFELAGVLTYLRCCPKRPAAGCVIRNLASARDKDRRKAEDHLSRIVSLRSESVSRIACELVDGRSSHEEV